MRTHNTVTVPAGLLEAREFGELVICVGPELGRSAGLPSMAELARMLLADAEVNDPSLDSATLAAWIAGGRVPEALESLERRMGARYQRVVERSLAELGRPLPALARAIAALETPLRAVFTTGLDRLLERAFADAWPSFSTVQGDLARRRKLIVKLCGTLEFPETWVLTRAAFEREFCERGTRYQLLAAACRAHCLLFVGFEPADAISERLLSAVESSAGGEQLPVHYLVVESCSPEERARLERRGILVITGGPMSLLTALADRSPTPRGSVHELPSCPYPGLQAFDQSLVAVFHGRRAEISAAASRLGGPEGRHRRWLAIDGSSGVGKSSFVHAGLIPALRRGFAEGTPTRWPVACLRPGRQPLRALTTAVADALARGSSIEPSLNQHDVQDLPSKVAELVRRQQSPGAALLLVIDQFEEVVTVADPTERLHFAAALALLLDQQLVYLVTTIRSDFTALISTALPALARLLNEQAARYTLAPISRVGLRAAISEPAAQLGVHFEAELVERIASDAEQHLGRGRDDDDDVARTDDAALPLVAHVLRGLWDARAPEDLEICFAKYEALGGVSGALSRSADALLARLDGQQRARARQLLLRMVNVDDGRLTRRSLGRAEAVRLAGGGGEGERLLQLLSGGGGPRLIVIRNEGTDALVDLVHEALLREWDTLCGWIAADRSQLARDEALARRTAAWIDQGRPWRSLPRGPERRELLRGRAHGRREPEQHEYQRSMRIAGWLRGSAWLGFCGVLGVAAHWVIDQQRQAQATHARQLLMIDEAIEHGQRVSGERDEAVASNLRSKVHDEIMQMLAGGDCRAALQRVVDELLDDAELLREVVRCKVMVGELARIGGPPAVKAMAVDPGHDEVWVGREDGSVARWSLRDHRLEPVIQLPQAVDAMWVAPSGELLALRSSGQIRLITRSGDVVGAPCNGHELVFLPDGRHFAIRSASHEIELRSVADAGLVWELPTRGAVEALASADAGDRWMVATSTQSGSWISTLGLATPAVGDTLEVPKYLRDIAISPDGLHVASTADDKVVRLWSLASDEEIATVKLDARESSKRFVSFSHSGTLLASASEDDKVAILGLDLGVLRVLEDVDLRIRPLFAPGDQWLLTAGSDAHVEIREVSTGEPVARMQLGSRADALAFYSTSAPQRRGVLTLTSDGELIDWRIDDQNDKRIPNPHTQAVRSLAFARADFDQLLSGSSNGTVHVWSTAERQLSSIRLSGWIMALGSGPDNRGWAYSDAGTLFRWNSNHTPEPRTPTGMCASRLAALGAGGQLAIACDGAVQLWDLTGVEPKPTATLSTGLVVNSLAISPVDERLALGSAEGTIELFRITEPGHREELTLAHDGSVTALRFDERSRLLVSGGNDSIAKLWSLGPSADPIVTLPIVNNVESVAISSQANRVAVGDERGGIILTNLAGVELERLDTGCAPHRVNALEFSFDGQLLAAGCSNGSVHVWPVAATSQLDLACERLANTTSDSATLPTRCRAQD